MEYRLDKHELLEILRNWDRFLKRRVHLIACGGTAMTLWGVKASTKDVDFIVPEKSEYTYLIGKLKDLNYEQVTASGWQRKGDIFRFDLFSGKRIHTTELLESPLLPGNHQSLMEFSSLYIGILNEYDLIASKLFRGTGVDFEDCLMLVRARKNEIDLSRLERHYRELVSYDISEARVGVHIDRFLDLLKEEGLND
jgi:hypothetical protein